MTTDPLFSLNNVTKTIGSKTVLRNINLDIGSSEFFTIVGPSGGGKTTLLRLLNGLTDIDSGELLYRSQNIFNGSVADLRREVGLVFQQPVMLAGTVQDNLLVRQRWDNTFTVSDDKLFAALENVELPRDRLLLDARSLSGGEQQRLALARTLLNEPQVLLLDEPTANMDPPLASQILNTFSHLRTELDITIIMVCHNYHPILRLATTVAFLLDYTIAETGDISILSAPVTPAAKHFIRKID